MKRNRHLSFKQLLLCIFILLLFIVLTIFLFTRKHDSNEFQALARELFLTEITDNTLNMHYTMANPESFGIREYTPLLPSYVPGSATCENIERRNTLSKLSRIRPKELNDSDRLTYTLLQKSLLLEDSMDQYPYFSEPLGSYSGMQSELPILLSEYTFRGKQDIEDYLALIDQTDDYFLSLLTYEQEKAHAGMFMSRESLSAVRRQCDTIVTKESLEQNSHFLQTTFVERLSPLIENHIVSNEEAKKYISNHNRLLKTVLLPAYEKLSDGLFLLEDSCSAISPKGLASFPGGKEYYSLLLSKEASTALSVPEIKELLKDQLVECYTRLRILNEEYPELKDTLSYGDYENLSFSDSADMLKDLNARSAKNFPQLPNTSEHPRVSVKDVSPSLCEYTAPAFYLTSPLDDTNNNTIYINKFKVPSSLELYTTLAHEGQPGHMYQNVYSSRSLTEQDASPLRQLLWYGGYLEGWALYVEFQSFDYATDYFKEQNKPLEAACVQAEKYSRSLQLCLYSLLDIVIHSENASQNQVAKILESFGITEPGKQTAIYDYIADNPCNYPKYYVGYLELCRTKELAKEVWGDDYSELNFHSFFLSTGPCDFATLQSLL